MGMSVSMDASDSDSGSAPRSSLGGISSRFVDAPEASPTAVGSLEMFYTKSTRCVYSTCMSRVRTNIEIEDTYVHLIMDRYGVRTKTEAVDLALRQLAGQPMTREEALAMRGANVIIEAPSDTAPRSDS